MSNATLDTRCQSRRRLFAPLACLLFVGAMIGLTVNLAKLAAQAGIAPLGFLFWSVLGAGAVLTILSLGVRDIPPLHRRGFEYFLVSGLLSIAVPNALVFSAAPHVGAGFVALSFALPPLYTYAMALAAGIERPQLRRAVGVAFGIAGALILARSKLMQPGAALPWIAATLTVPVVVAAGNIYRTLRWPKGASSLSLAPGMLLGASVLLLLAARTAGVSIAFPAMGGIAMELLLIQSLGFSAMYLFYFVLQRMAGPVYLSQIGSVGAITGTAIAMLVLGESAPPALGLAAALIAMGVILVTSGSVAGRKGPSGLRSATPR